MSEIPLWTMGACPSCKKKLEIQDRKKMKCGKCGEFFSYSSKTKITAALVTLAIVFFVVKACSDSSNGVNTHPKQDQNTVKAEVAPPLNEPQIKSKKDIAAGYGTPLCEKIVKNGTAIPSSVDFTWAHNLTEQQDGTFVKTGSFTHKNAYGQKLKKEYQCKIFLSKSNLDVVSVKIIALQEIE